MKIEFNAENHNNSKIRCGIAAYFCPHCATKIFSNFPEDFEALRNLQQCPICSNNLLKEKGFYIENGDLEFDEICDPRYFHATHVYPKGGKAQELFSPSNPKSVYKYMQTLRRSEEERAAEQTVEKLISCALRSTIANPEGGAADKIKASNDLLKKYILNLITIETNIYSTQKQLSELYISHVDAKRLALQGDRGSSYQVKVQKEKQISELKGTLQRTVCEFELLKKKSPTAVCIPKPTEPQAPTLEKPGLFNKKKVEESNAKILAKYEEDVAAYNRSIAEWKSKLEKASNIAQSEHTTALNTASKAVEKARHALQKAESDYSEMTSRNSQKVLPSPQNAYKALLEQSIEKAESLLKEQVACRKKLYDLNVIFEKYRNVVALSNIYEYLLSGRCGSLEGANGAYNLYESEVRSNLIISQLSNVIDSLEQIKDSQYMIYSKLSEVNVHLNELNSTMKRAANSIEHIAVNTDSMVTYMEHISENLDVIAFNSATTAYYSKLNADLTNALGFMAALK